MSHGSTSSGGGGSYGGVSFTPVSIGGGSSGASQGPAPMNAAMRKRIADRRAGGPAIGGVPTVPTVPVGPTGPAGPAGGFNLDSMMQDFGKNFQSYMTPTTKSGPEMWYQGGTTAGPQPYTPPYSPYTGAPGAGTYAQPAPTPPPLSGPDVSRVMAYPESDPFVVKPGFGYDYDPTTVNVASLQGERGPHAFGEQLWEPKGFKSSFPVGGKGYGSQIVPEHYPEPTVAIPATHGMSEEVKATYLRQQAAHDTLRAQKRERDAREEQATWGVRLPKAFRREFARKEGGGRVAVEEGPTEDEIRRAKEDKRERDERAEEVRLDAARNAEVGRIVDEVRNMPYGNPEINKGKKWGGVGWVDKWRRKIVKLAVANPAAALAHANALRHAVLKRNPDVFAHQMMVLKKKKKPDHSGGGGGGGMFNRANAEAAQRNWEEAMRLLEEARDAIANNPLFQKAEELMMAMMSGEGLPFTDQVKAQIFGGISDSLTRAMQERIRVGEGAIGAANLRGGAPTSYTSAMMGDRATADAAARAQEATRMTQANAAAKQQAVAQASAVAAQQAAQANAVRQQMAQAYFTRQYPALV